jgi:hypothetical protein
VKSNQIKFNFFTSILDIIYTTIYINLIFYKLMKKPFSRLKNRVESFKITFKNKFQQNKQKPKSRRKSFMIGFTTAIGLFGLTLFGPALSAVAKEIPKEMQKKNTDIAPAPSVPPGKELISTGLSGAAASVCALAVTSGSFAVGLACGVLVVIGILRLQGK